MSMPISPELRTLVTADGAMILNIPNDEIVTLNATGGHVWSQIKDGKTVDEIVQTLSKETGEDSAVVANDIREFIGQLTAQHLLTLVGPA